MDKCQNPFCPKCHPDAFYRLQLDQNTLNSIGVAYRGMNGQNLLLGVQMRLSQLCDYLEQSCHE